MPAAKASNNTTAPTGQPVSNLPQNVQADFENIGTMLAAFNEMNGALHETGENHSDISFGIYLIHKLIMDKLTQVTEAANKCIDRAYRQGKVDGGQPNTELVEKLLKKNIWPIIVSVCAEHSVDLEDNGTHLSWMGFSHAVVAKIIAMMKDQADPVEAGSFLPWAEVHIRQEMERAGEAFADKVEATTWLLKAK